MINPKFLSRSAVITLAVLVMVIKKRIAGASVQQQATGERCFAIKLAD
jgi:hypothetical protein